LKNEELIDNSPMAKIRPPSAKTEVKQPVSEEHIQKLLKACKKSVYPRRDEAILLLLIDTGLRASELCQMKCGDVDLQARTPQGLGQR
jgi:integrase